MGLLDLQPRPIIIDSDNPTARSPNTGPIHLDDRFSTLSFRASNLLHVQTCQFSPIIRP